MPRGSEGKIAVIVGLGNPGEKYHKTRHNAGFRVVDLLAENYSALLQDRKFKAAWGFFTAEGQKILLVKPLTFMNRSGEPVGEILRYFNFSHDQMLVIHDDLDLPNGRIRVARGGGAGGHRGVANIIEHLGVKDFPRLKLGIGRPVHGEPVEAFVLQSPYAVDEEAFEEMLKKGADATKAILTEGLVATMNRFNRRSDQRAEGD
jgi:peptidyl-tRNA hydrolase, PTH1 family